MQSKTNVDAKDLLYITYIVKSTHTNEIVFQRTCDLYLNLQQSTGIGGLAGALADLALSATATALTEHIEAARMCNMFIFKDFPRGKYSPDYQKDKDSQSEAQNVKKNCFKIIRDNLKEGDGKVFLSPSFHSC